MVAGLAMLGAEGLDAIDGHHDNAWRPVEDVDVDLVTRNQLARAATGDDDGG
jgi:hypothetical protein